MTDRAVSLALVSHTNVGKTALARTLLGRDVGEVRDAPHVTEFSDAHALVETADGERLTLWDTPGFGDSVRLARRLTRFPDPIARFIGETWDRWRDRPLWAGQQAVRTIRDEADVLLYLVNAAEPIEQAGYVRPEMTLLGWIGKPVIVLLNQLGAPRERALEQAEVERWRNDLRDVEVVRQVLPLDAFARCWVQELTLLDAVERALPDARRPLMARLRRAWQARRTETFDASMRAIAESLARSAALRAPVAEPARFADKLRVAAAAVGWRKGESTPALDAQKELVRRLDDELRRNTRELIALHGLAGQAEGEIVDRLATQVDVRLRLDETRAALWGGAVSGALGGLAADVLSGGATLGGGMIAGGVLGALGGAGLARSVNLVRGADRSHVAWNVEALDALVEAALLRYLAVAHFGRGRGDWRAGESAPHWRALVEAALAGERDELAQVWSRRAANDGRIERAVDPRAVHAADDGAGRAANARADRVAHTRADRAADEGAGERTPLALALEPIVRAASLRVLRELYPEAAAALR